MKVTRSVAFVIELDEDEATELCSSLTQIPGMVGLGVQLDTGQREVCTRLRHAIIDATQES